MGDDVRRLLDEAVAALETITVEVDGRRMYRTRNGVPMEMPAKFDRIVRAALARVRESMSA